jgi:hypothetical protein
MKRFAPVILIGTLLVAACGGQSGGQSATISNLSGDVTASGNLITSGAVRSDVWGSPVSCSGNGMCWDLRSGILVAVNGSLVNSAQRTKPKPKYTLAQVRASAVAIPKARLAPAAYLTLAKSIGLESAGTDEARMLDCLDKLSLKPYDADKVDAYLTHKAEAQGPNIYWLWKPLREPDERSVNAAAASGRTPGVPLSGKRYGQAVPAHALETVAMVLREMPDAVFLVSDYEAVKPDPFLAVTTVRLLQEGRVWIIVAWNEPSFGVPDIRFGPVADVGQ